MSRWQVERFQRGGGCSILLDGVVVAITTGTVASARTLVGQADFRAECESWLDALRKGEPWSGR